MEQKIREQAERLYRRGLHVFARLADYAGIEGLELVAQLWQKSWELYRKIGDEDKARELEKSLAALYKRKYQEVQGGKGKRGGIIEKFTPHGCLVNLFIFSSSLWNSSFVL